MTQKELYEAMSYLYKNDIDKKLIIQKAVQLGMQYQEEKIKEGIGIVFNELGS